MKIHFALALVAVAALGCLLAIAPDAAHSSTIMATLLVPGAVRAGLPPGVVPRAVMAATDAARGAKASRSSGADRPPAEMLSEIAAAFEEFKERHEGQLDGVQAVVDDLSARIASGAVGATIGSGRLEDPEYSKLFAGYFRKGSAEDDLKAQNATGQRSVIQAAMSVGTDSQGGYLAPVEWDRKVNKALRSVSPMRRIANVVPTTTQAFSTVWHDAAWGTGWVGETASRPATATPTLSSIVFPAGEIYCNPSITQRLLDDAAFDIEQWIAEETAEEFARQEGIAFISGDGVNKPMGLLRYAPDGTAASAHPGGALGVTISGDAALLKPDALIDLVYALAAPYRQNARWLMNSKTAGAAAKLKDGQGNYLWRDAYVSGQPATLLGFPVEIDENMPDVAAGAYPIAFGDFNRGYLINDRTGVRVLRDPYTNKPYVLFYTTKRVGAGLLSPNAIRLLKVSAS